MIPHCGDRSAPAAMRRCQSWAWLAMALGCVGPAAAQVYTGTSDNGTIVLSDVPSPEARLLLIEAPVLHRPKTMSTAALDVAHMPLPVEPRAMPARTPVPALPSRLLPLILTVARDHHLSAPLLAAVAAAESAFDPGAVSPKGAAGLMQLMPATAQRFKVGNRYSPIQSLNGGAAYLRWLSDRYGDDLQRVLAAYNAGEQAVALADGVPPYAETQAYVQRVLHYLKHYSQVL
jgi:soluble lytic murein transglycosylase-like protein